MVKERTDMAAPCGTLIRSQAKKYSFCVNMGSSIVQSKLDDENIGTFSTFLGQFAFLLRVLF